MADGFRRFAAGLLGGQDAVNRFDHKVGVRDSNLPAHFQNLDPAFASSLLDLRHKQAQAKAAARLDTRTQQANQNLGYDPNFHLAPTEAQKGFVGRQERQQTIQGNQAAFPHLGLPSEAASVSDSLGPAAIAFHGGRRAHEEGRQDDFRQQGIDAYSEDRALDPLRNEASAYHPFVSNYAVSQGAERGTDFLDRWRKNSAAEKTTANYLTQMGAIDEQGNPDALKALNILQKLSVVKGDVPAELARSAEFIQALASSRGFSVAQAADDLLGRIDSYNEHQQERERVFRFSQSQGGGQLDAPTEAPQGGGQGGGQLDVPTDPNGGGQGASPYPGTNFPLDGDIQGLLNGQGGLNAPTEAPQGGGNAITNAFAPGEEQGDPGGFLGIRREDLRRGSEYGNTYALEALKLAPRTIFEGIRSLATSGFEDADEFDNEDIGLFSNTHGESPDYSAGGYANAIAQGRKRGKFRLGRPNPSFGQALGETGDKLVEADEEFALGQEDAGPLGNFAGILGSIPAQILAQIAHNPISQAKVNAILRENGEAPLTADSSKWASIASGTGDLAALFGPKAGFAIQKMLGARATEIAAKGGSARLVGRRAAALAQGTANTAAGGLASGPTGAIEAQGEDESKLAAFLKTAAVGATVAGLTGAAIPPLFSGGGKFQRKVDAPSQYVEAKGAYNRDVAGFEDPFGAAKNDLEVPTEPSGDRAGLESAFNDPARRSADDAAVDAADSARNRDPVDQELDDISDKVFEKRQAEKEAERLAGINAFLRARGLPELGGGGDAPTPPPNSGAGGGGGTRAPQAPPRASPEGASPNAQAITKDIADVDTEIAAQRAGLEDVLRQSEGKKYSPKDQATVDKLLQSYTKTIEDLYTRKAGLESKLEGAGDVPTPPPPRPGEPPVEPGGQSRPGAPPPETAGQGSNPRIAELDAKIAAAERDLQTANLNAGGDADAAAPARNALETLRAERLQLAKNESDSILEAGFYSKPYEPVPPNERPPASVGINELNEHIQPLKDQLQGFLDTLEGRAPTPEEISYINGIKRQIEPLINYRRQLEDEQGGGGGGGRGGDGGDTPTPPPPRDASPDAPTAPPDPQVAEIDSRLSHWENVILEATQDRDNLPVGSKRRGQIQQRINRAYAAQSELENTRRGLVPEGESPPSLGGRPSPPPRTFRTFERGGAGSDDRNPRLHPQSDRDVLNDAQAQSDTRFERHPPEDPNYVPTQPPRRPAADDSPTPPPPDPPESGSGGGGGTPRAAPADPDAPTPPPGEASASAPGDAPTAAQQTPEIGDTPTELPPLTSNKKPSGDDGIPALVEQYNKAQENYQLQFPQEKFYGSPEHFRWNVVPLDELTISSDKGYKPYGALQPRKGGDGGIDPVRVAQLSSQFEAERAANMNNDLGSGAPIEIEGVVIGGNNRVAAIRQLSPDKLAEYNKAVDKVATEAGLSPVANSIREAGGQPIFVRTINEDALTPERLLTLAQETNRKDLGSYTPSATAALRGAKFQTQLQKQMNAGGEGARSSGLSRSEVEGAYKATLIQEEKAEFVNAEGQLTPGGHRNLDDALFAVAIGAVEKNDGLADALIQAAASRTDSDIKGIYNAVVESGGDLVYLENKFKAFENTDGQVGFDPKYRLENSFSSVISAIEKARRDQGARKMIDGYNDAQSRGLSDGGIDTNEIGKRDWEMDDALWRLFYKFDKDFPETAPTTAGASGHPRRARGGGKVSDILQSYAKKVEEEGNTGGMFEAGESRSPRTLLREAIEEVDGPDKPKGGKDDGLSLGDGEPPGSPR